MANAAKEENLIDSLCLHKLHGEVVDEFWQMS